MEIADHLIFVAAFLLLMSIFIGTFTKRMGMPLLLILLLTGMLFGQDGFGIPFDNAQLAYNICSFALAVILFNSGMHNNRRFFKAVWWPACTLATLGVVLTSGIVALGAWWLFDFSPLSAVLIGALVGSTDAAAVLLLLSQRDVNISRKLSATLESESGLNDPMAVLLTLGTTMLLTAPETTTPLTLATLLAKQAAIGVAVGISGGYLIRKLLGMLNVSVGAAPILVLAWALFVFASSNMLGGSGFLAAYLAGMILADRDYRFKNQAQQFMDGMGWLAQMSMMLALGLLITPSELPSQWLTGLGLAFVLLFVARPIAVWLSLLPFKFNRREVAFIGWVGLRGGIPIYLAIIPMLMGIDSQHLYFNTAFMVVLVSLLLQGTTINVAANRLGLTAGKK